MILTVIHTILLILCVLAVIRLFVTDYLRQKEQDETKALQMELNENGQIFDLLVLIVLTLIF